MMIDRNTLLPQSPDQPRRGIPSPLLTDTGRPYRGSGEQQTESFVRHEWEIDATHYDITVCREADSTGGGAANETNRIADDRPETTITIHDESRLFLGARVSFEPPTDKVVQYRIDERCGKSRGGGD